MTSRRSLALLRLLGVSVATACAMTISACGDASGTGDLWHSGGPDDPSGSDPGSGGSGGGGSSSSSTNGATGGSGGSGGSTTGGGGSGSGSGGGTGSGSSGSGSGGETAKGSIAVALDKSSASLDLMTKSDFTVTVTPSQGFTGAVTLGTTGLPTGATATFTPATLEVTGTAPMTAKLEINVASTVTPTGATPAQVAVTATGAASPASATLALGVNAKISFFIPNNAPNQPNVFGIPSVTVNFATISSKTPLTVVITNLDASRDHIVHANGQNGFQHGDTGNPLGVNESMTRMVTGKGNYPFYLHDFSGTNPSTTLKIQ